MGIALAGKVVIVTGASSGIGEAVAMSFLERGADVVLLSREAARAEAARRRLGRADHSLALACVVRRREDIDRVRDLALERFRRIDVWVNNAGFGLHHPVADMDLGACRDLFETNLFGVVNGMKSVIPVMKGQGSGTIINISSVAGHIPLPWGAAYSASKAAVNALGKAARVELRAHGVHVLTVCPGYVATDFASKVVTSQKDRRSRSVRRITPERVARAVLRGYRLGKREVIVPWTMIPAVKLYQMFPGLVEWAMARGDRGV
jgi:short-subunit dehydrogenase